MSAPAAIALLLLACGGGEPVAPPSTPVPAKPPPAAVTGVPAPATLDPRPPSRHAPSPFPLADSPALARARERLGAVVDGHAGDPDNPWAIVHGLLARGPDFRLADGRPAIDVLYGRYGKLVALGGGVEGVAFPDAVGSTRVEPHTDLVLKSVVEAGVPPGREVVVEGSRRTAADHWRGSLLATWLDMRSGASSYASPNDMPWGVQALAAWGWPGLAWSGPHGTQRLDDLARLLLVVLDKESRPLYAAMEQGAPFTKRGQGVLRYTCGGAHLLQAAGFVVARGFVPDIGPAVLARQARLAAWRMPQEADLVERAIAEHPDQALRLAVQQLKFLGHWLESVHELAALGVFPSDDPALRAGAADAADRLVHAVERLVRMGALDRMQAIRDRDEQLYLDLVGDSAHALHGIDLATGRVEVRW